MYNANNIDEYKKYGVIFTMSSAEKIQIKNKKRPKMMFSTVLLGLTAAILTVTSVLYRQTPFMMLPLFVSLVVGILQAEANRYACLIGGINSLIYTAVYLTLGIYGSAAQALLVSCPFQLATFARWSKHAYKNSTEFKRMSKKARIILLAVLSVCYMAALMILNVAGSGYRLLDGATSLLGAATSVLTLLSYIEYTWLMLVSGLLGIALNVAVSLDRPEMITYTVFSIYSFICVVRQFFSVRRIYAEQEKERIDKYEKQF